MKHLLNIHSQDRDSILHLLREAARLKAAHEHGEVITTLRHKIVALIFEKPSLRTRVSFESGVMQLGGSSLFLPGGDVGLGVRESLADFARTLSQYVDGLVMRVFKQATVDGVAERSSIPVINGLSDTSHPCQALADLLTIQEWFGEVDGKTVAFVGDGNNVARSLAIACGKLGGKLVLARPDGYGFDADFAAKYRKHVGGSLPEETKDPAAAVKHADVIYTDVWTSMGQETEREQRLKLFAPYQVNAALLAKAPRHVKILHCLPAHRGEEITDEVIESPASVVFQQAGNRLHAQKAVLEWLLGVSKYLRIRGTQTGLRDPSQVDRLKQEMLQKTFAYAETDARLTGLLEPPGTYHISDGHHRMVAALEILRETGDDGVLRQLLYWGSWKETPTSPRESRPMPSRRFWGKFRNWLGF